MKEALMKASEEGNIDGLYAAIRENPHILALIDEIPFVDTPLHIAVAAGHIQYAKEIMRLKPSFAQKLNYDGFTPIHVALKKNNMEMVLWLINKDAELARVKGREGVTPFHYVVEHGIGCVLDRFLSVCPGAIEDVTIRNETALHIALKNDMVDIFELLVDWLYRDSPFKEDDYWKKMILNCKDVEGNTVLHIATIRNLPKALQVLIKYENENPGMLEAGIVNNNGKTEAIFNPTTTPEPQQAHNQNQEVTIAVSSDRGRIYAWEDYFKFEFKKDKRDNTRSDLLVVAVLMATATYQAALSPPGGLHQDKPESLLASSDPWMYIMFLTFNSIGFFLSLNTIRILIYKYPMYLETYAAILGMIITYNIAINAISPSGIIVKIFGYISASVPLLVVIIPFFLRLCCKGGRRRLQGYRRHQNV